MGEFQLATHGMSYSPEYRIWVGMVHRCSNKNAANFDLYGARGIRVCPEWATFENFYRDMGPRPSPDHSIDRRDNDGNYEPANCHWANPIEQANNKRHLTKFQYRGRLMTLAQALREAGSVVTDNCARKRIREGAPIEYAVEAPATPRGWRHVSVNERAHGWAAGPNESAA